MCIRDRSKSSQEVFSISDNLSVPLREARENFEKEYLTTQLKKNHGNISKTADFIGMERSALHRKLKSLVLILAIFFEILNNVLAN